MFNYIISILSMSAVSATRDCWRPRPGVPDFVDNNANFQVQDNAGAPWYVPAYSPMMPCHYVMNGVNDNLYNTMMRQIVLIPAYTHPYPNMGVYAGVPHQFTTGNIAYQRALAPSPSNHHPSSWYYWNASRFPSYTPAGYGWTSAGLHHNHLPNALSSSGPHSTDLNAESSKSEVSESSPNSVQNLPNVPSPLSGSNEERENAQTQSDPNPTMAQSLQSTGETSGSEPDLSDISDAQNAIETGAKFDEGSTSNDTTVNPAPVTSRSIDESIDSDCLCSTRLEDQDSDAGKANLVLSLERIVTEHCDCSESPVEKGAQDPPEMRDTMELLSIDIQATSTLKFDSEDGGASPLLIQFGSWSHNSPRDSDNSEPVESEQQLDARLELELCEQDEDFRLPNKTVKVQISSSMCPISESNRFDAFDLEPVLEMDQTTPASDTVISSSTSLAFTTSSIKSCKQSKKCNRGKSKRKKSSTAALSSSAKNAPSLNDTLNPETETVSVQSVPAISQVSTVAQQAVGDLLLPIIGIAGFGNISDLHRLALDLYNTRLFKLPDTEPSSLEHCLLIEIRSFIRLIQTDPSSPPQDLAGIAINNPLVIQSEIERMTGLRDQIEDVFAANDPEYVRRHIRRFESEIMSLAFDLAESLQARMPIFQRFKNESSPVLDLADTLEFLLHEAAFRAFVLHSKLKYIFESLDEFKWLINTAADAARIAAVGRLVDKLLVLDPDLQNAVIVELQRRLVVAQNDARAYEILSSYLTSDRSLKSISKTDDDLDDFDKQLLDSIKEISEDSKLSYHDVELPRKLLDSKSLRRISGDKLLIILKSDLSKYLADTLEECTMRVHSSTNAIHDLSAQRLSAKYKQDNGVNFAGIAAVICWHAAREILQLRKNLAASVTVLVSRRFRLLIDKAVTALVQSGNFSLDSEEITNGLRSDLKRMLQVIMDVSTVEETPWSTREHMQDAILKALPFPAARNTFYSIFHQYSCSAQ